MYDFSVVGGVTMVHVMVYRVDNEKASKTPIGSVRERRNRERGDNLVGLLRLAKRTYASSPKDMLRISVGGVWVEF
jgi:hypothetical protein